MLAAVLTALAALPLLAACDSDDEALPAAVPPLASVETIVTPDGLDLDARLFAASSPAPEAGARLVILLHMYAADQTAWYGFAGELQALGIDALTLDFRGFGDSAGGQGPSETDRDVRAAVAFARGRGYERIVLVGASMGGTAAIVAAADTPVDGVVAISAPVAMRSLDAEAVVAELRAPLTLVAAEGDVSAVESLRDLAERAGLRHDEVLLTAGRAHGTDLLGAPEGATVRAWVLGFLERVWAAQRAAGDSTQLAVAST